MLEDTKLLVHLLDVVVQFIKEAQVEVLIQVVAAEEKLEILLMLQVELVGQV